MSVRCQRINTSLSDGDAGRTCWHHGPTMRNRLPLAQLREPYWKRQPSETVIAYATDRHFRDLDPSERSVARVSRDTGRNCTMLEDRALRWRWRERTAAYDEHLDELALKSQEDAVRAMNARHAELGLQGLRLVLQRLTGDDIRYLAESRLTIEQVGADGIRARCRGSGADYLVTWTAREGWRCSCPALGRCSHVIALQSVTVR